MKNGRSKDDEMSREIWKVVETKAGEARVVEVKEGRKIEIKEEETEERGRKEMAEKTEKGENNGSKEDGRRVKNLE